MAIVGISRFETEKFFSERDKEKETEFTIGSLDVDMKARLSDKMYSIGIQGVSGMGIGTNKNVVYLEAVRYGLRGWNNFKDSKGKPLEFKTKEWMVYGKPYTIVDDDSLQMLPSWLISELGRKILDRNEVDVALKGNFGMA